METLSDLSEMALSPCLEFYKPRISSVFTVNSILFSSLILAFAKHSLSFWVIFTLRFLCDIIFI